jgi:MFS family permease
MFNGFLIFGILAIAAFFIWFLAAEDHPPKPPEPRTEVPRMRFHEGINHVFNSRNAYVYPMIGFFVVGMNLFTSAFLSQLYPGTEGGYIAGLLLYGCAVGAFEIPFFTKRVGLKKVTVFSMLGAILFWLIMLASNSHEISWLYIVPIAFLFGFCMEASWPLALYCQETEVGVSEANVGIASSVYISVSNIGAAVIPVVFPLLFKTNFLSFIAVFSVLILCAGLWAIVKRK